MQIDDTNVRGRLYLHHCEKGTPSAKIRKWRTTIRDGILIRVNDKPVTTKQQLIEIIQ